MLVFLNPFPHSFINFALCLSKSIDELVEFLAATFPKQILPFINIKYKTSFIS